MRRAALVSWGLRMDAAFFILLGMVVVAAGIGLFRDPALPLRGLFASGKLLRSVWVELCFGFILAGLLEVLIPQPTLSRWLGAENVRQGVLAGWAAGLLIPGGAVCGLPHCGRSVPKRRRGGAADHAHECQDVGEPHPDPDLRSPPAGWPLTLARLLPALVLPPILGLVGHWLFEVLRHD